MRSMGAGVRAKKFAFVPVKVTEDTFTAVPYLYPHPYCVLSCQNPRNVSMLLSPAVQYDMMRTHE